MVRVPVRPELLRWARERSGIARESLLRPFPRLDAWERGEVSPTLKQVERYARRTHVPVGYLFLEEPPEEVLPIPDFRTMGDARLSRPSPDLLETIYICQDRQDWYRDHARRNREPPLEFVGSASLRQDAAAVASEIRTALDFDVEVRAELSRWTDALRLFVEQADDLGVLVMTNGVVGNNTRRRLDPQEFRGFALVDEYAPVVFVNGADTRAAQMFTLAHELAHVWLGQSALSDVQAAVVSEHATERWCNEVAAELLVPLELVGQEYDETAPLQEEMTRLARRFKVSTLVVLRRLCDAGHLTRQAMWTAYQDELERLLEIPRGSGGNFYATEVNRVSERFARAVVTSTLEGQTLYQDAFRMFGISKLKTFETFGKRLGISR